ncbi:MAG TPA: transposase [Candidatus Paceibacterota bacterium]|nr:transposase [Candidatus Paceibacterota bacterium]
MERKINFSINEYYHLYNRGTDKHEIFLDSKDYLRFKALLYVCNSSDSVDIARHFKNGRTFSDLFFVRRKRTLVDIGAYCLMPNHFHILVKEKIPGGVTQFMLKLLTGYSMYFNKKHKRTGPVFERAFKAKHVNTDTYLKYLFAYIHLNPVKIIDPEWKESGISDIRRTERYLNSYQNSSYLIYQQKNYQEEEIINKGAFPEYFEKVDDFNDFIKEWLLFNTHEGLGEGQG